jgi:RNA polymerase sigma-70 factor (ECF subfamily)
VPRSDILARPGPVDTDDLDIALLFRQHARTVARWAARLGGPGIDVEDVVQDVFMIAGRRLTHFTGEAKVTTWLFRATERVVHGLRRKQRLRRWLARSGDEVSPHLTSQRLTPVEEFERHQATRAVYRILDGLSDRYRRVMILFELEGLSTEEIAQLLGAKQATVRVWLFRGRAQFLAEKERLEQRRPDGAGRSA